MSYPGPHELTQDKRVILENYIPVPECGCWLFLGGWGTYDGVRLRYARVQLRKSPELYSRFRHVMAHRFFYEELVGPIPKGFILCHKCDTPPCVNPDHLFIGTHKDNADDMISKGRKALVIGLGFRSTKLNDDQVRVIFGDPRKQKEIAADYGIRQQHVSRIKTRRRRYHVDLQLAQELAK